MRHLIAVALCIVFAGPAIAQTYTRPERPMRPVAGYSPAALPPVQLYALRHQMMTDPDRFAGTVDLDWRVTVRAPGRSSCDVHLRFLDEAGNVVQHTTRSARLAGGVSNARGSLTVTREEAQAVRRVSASADCL